MLDRLKSLFSEQSPPAGGHTHDQLQLAAAALLVEAARMDDSFDSTEREVIGRLLRERFGLDEASAASLLDAASDATEDSVELYTFSRRVKDAFDHDERVGMVEMLWEVVYADGEVHDHEANLLRRVAGLLYVSDRESGEARKRVLDRSGAAT